MDQLEDGSVDMEKARQYAVDAATFCYKYASLVAGRRHQGNADVVALIKDHPPSDRLLNMYAHKYQTMLSRPLLIQLLDLPGAVQPRYRDITIALSEE